MNILKTINTKALAVTALVIALIASAGCASDPKIVHADADTSGTGAGLDSRDCEAVAKGMLQDLFRSQRLTNPNGGRYVMTVGRIANYTKLLDFRSDQVMWTIREELTNSGQVVITSAVSSDKNNVNADVMGVRELRGDDEFDQSRVAQKGSLQAPDLSITGKIFESNNRIKNDVRREYYFQLKITDLKTGLDFWQKQELIVKQGDKKKMNLR